MKSKIKGPIRSTILICFAVLVCYSPAALSAVPEIINYQGSLSDSGGNPVNATLNITFTLYDVDAGPGTTLWQETQAVTVTNGQFSVELGADGGNPLPALLDDPVFLGVQVDADAEMTPRQKFTSTAFALRAKTVENDTLNSLSCAANEIPKFNGSVWVCAVDDSGTGDITGVTVGNGLTGGGLSGDVNIAVDTNVIQNRVSGSCPAGQSIRVVNANGTVTCEVDTDTDTNTTYSAGSGLTLSGTTFSIPTSGIDATHIAPNSVGTSELADGGVNFADLHDNSKGVGSGGVLVIPAAAFRPQNASATNYSYNFSGYISIFFSNSLCILAPAQLPNGVTVTLFEIIVFDNSAAQNIAMNLTRNDIADLGIGNTSTMATATSTGAFSTVRTFNDNTINSANVNAADNQYFVSGCWTNDALLPPRFYAARITYN